MKNKFGLKKLIPFGIGLLVLAAFVGSVSGSLAWWAFSTRVSVSYQGTSVTTSEQLQIGLKLDRTVFNTDEKVDAIGLEEDEDLSAADEHYRYVFAEAGSGLSASAISTYSRTMGHASNELAPVTSKSYTTGGSFALRESLVGFVQNNNELALDNKYVKVPFVFRILKLNSVSAADKYADGRDIYLSKVVSEAAGSNPDSNIAEALRIFFKGTNEFILNPSDDTTELTGTTQVCGVLNIGGSDNFYDCDEYGKEIIYGDYTYGSEPATFVPTAEQAAELSNINNVTLPGTFDYTDLTQHTTFLSAHEQGKQCYANYDDITPGVQQYRTMAAIKPDDTHATLTGGEALCTTASAAGNYLAELEATIWLEGWDHAIVDTAISHQFNLGLQFQIDLVN